jgi:hypothetical protein
VQQLQRCFDHQLALIIKPANGWMIKREKQRNGSSGVGGGSRASNGCCQYFNSRLDPPLAHFLPMAAGVD